MDGQIEPLGAGPDLKHIEHFGDDLRRRAFDSLDVEGPRFDLGNVEDVVDDLQKVHAVAADRVDRGEPFLGRGLGFQQDFGVVDRSP